MTVGVATCLPDIPVGQVARLLVEKNLEAVIVMDPDEGHALGVIGQDDLVRVYARSDVRELTAGQVMREGVPQCPADIPVAVAAQLMRDQGVRMLFIMHHASGVEYPAASIAYYHVIRHLAAEGDDDLKDLGMHAQRLTPRDAFIQRREEARRRNQGNQQ